MKAVPSKPQTTDYAGTLLPLEDAFRPLAFDTCSLCLLHSSGAPASRSDGLDVEYNLFCSRVTTRRSCAVLPLFCYILGPETFQLIAESKSTTILACCLLTTRVDLPNRTFLDFYPLGI